MFLLSICLGSVNFSLSEVLQTLLGHGDANAVHRQIILDFRLPQVLTALLSGAALGTAGLLMQTVFRNPLADPFVLGVNSGASLGVAIVLLALGPIGLELNRRPRWLGADALDPRLKWRRGGNALYRATTFTQGGHHVCIDHWPND